MSTSSEEKPLFWTGSSKEDLMNFPRATVSEMGHALGLAQQGLKYGKAKPWKGEGPGVFEIVSSFDGNAFRAVYTVRFERAVYVLHAFQKKSPSGVRTDARDVTLVSSRLRSARHHYIKEFSDG
jgi:phage-related protein